MYLAYLDESGDSGLNNSPTQYFILSCILVNEENWLKALDLLVKLRSSLKTKYKIPTRPEIKSRYLRNGQGIFSNLHLSLTERMSIYRGLLKYQEAQLPVKVFSVAMDKNFCRSKRWEPRFAAWTIALERINKFCLVEKQKAIILPDEGHGYFIRLRMRCMRRYHSVPSHYGTPGMSFKIGNIIEDPNNRQSHDSYFIQLADWNALATHRSKYVDPQGQVPNNLWDELNKVLLRDVNKVKGGPPGIVKP
jgi:hypothetical protein